MNLAQIVDLFNGRHPEEATAQKGESENLPILIGRLYQMGISGIHGDAAGV